MSHIFRELGRNIGRHWSTVLGLLMSMTLMFLLFDIFWVAAATSQRFYDRLLAEVQMEVVFDEAPSDSTVAILRVRTAELEGVNAIRYISKEDARLELSRLVGTDLLVGYDSHNPLPRSMILTFQPDFLHTAHLEKMENLLHEMNGISEVFYSRLWISKVEKATGLIREGGMVLGILILLAALISSANNVRLMAQTRATGLNQMRLLGAGKFFLAAPFLLEGMLIGGLASAAGWAVIQYAHSEITFSKIELVLPTLEQQVVAVAACALLGLVSGYLGIRKTLR